VANDTDVVVILTTGKQDRGARATLAFSWACTALAMGKSVALYLTMDGTVWAINGAAGGVQVEGFEALSEYMAQFAELGGRLLVCAPCTEYYCSFNREKIGETLIPEAQLAGLSTVVGTVGPQCGVVTF
jgi:uncharacterized protein involved in oxidation of intracellular sulfur